jgi:type IV pilus secretin PilQ/predicted competence protein
MARATGLVRGPALLLALALAAPGAARAGAGGDAPATGAQRNQIVQVDSNAEGQATWIRLRGTRPASFTVHRLERPARIVIDVPHAQLAPAVRDGGWNVSSWAVDRVTAQQTPRAGTDAVRVVVWLARPATYRVANEGRDLVVRLTARAAAPPAGSVQAAARPTGTASRQGVKAKPVRVRADRQPADDDDGADDPGDDDPRDGDVDEGAARPATPGASRTLAVAEKAALAQRADARRAVTKAKRARRAASQAVRKHRRNATQLRMKARKLEAIADDLCARAETAEREADQLRAEAEEAAAAQTRVAAAPAGKAAAPAVKAASTTVKAAPTTVKATPTTVKATPTAPAGKMAPRPLPQRQIASTAAAAPPMVPRRPVTPPASTPSGAPAPATSATPLRRAPETTDYASPAVAGYGESSGPITQQSVSQVQQRRRKVYRGRKIDLDLKDADVHNLMRLLADVGGVNIVVPDNVKASITVRLRDVPWDQAMEVILASKGLWYRREGGLIRVAPRKELDAEDQAESERIRALAESEAPETQVFTLNYADAGKVRDQLTPLLSPKGRIEVDARTNSLIINDISAHRRRIVGLVTQLDYQTPQIQIEARVVEARTDWNRDFGIQWGGSVNASAAGGNSTGLVFPNSVNVTGGADGPPSGGVVASPSDFAVNLPSVAGAGEGGAIGLSLGSVGGNINLNLRLSAAESTGTIRIISAPRITTSNNIEASIKSGTSIPISVISANGVQTQFVPADLLLRVTPAVSQRDCAVSMQVNITKNEADFVNTGARGDPSILTKEAKTTVLVADGQTAVIGGIYTRNTGIGYKKVPFLADIPVLGWLFKSRSENDNRTEVLLFITPKITNRAFLRCE